MLMRSPHRIKSLAHRLVVIPYHSRFKGGAGISKELKTVKHIAMQSVSP